ncbi:hypothetical protein SARC_07103 [Sphaeroforma arctica JP610]|uniref:EGF-like domain-containing protein n=1 Tax=Sphaeroforma arctica JP610 TaxID=667725 RepID=A0A0L0FVE2_9EUKA|nr:hypothetical protein SARC_07103 [Sphaeroforma arctica JP610]KNC80531.1 hypothetical protein SARC_07103 [Sphaeroforma arctica JP610]|eukprot:XP_014154433.1 hypothetical protein SARC_07103 [Sphaeroforma arctica JP610]
MKFAAAIVSAFVGSSIAGNILVKVNSYTTSRCDCDVGTFECNQPSLTSPQCQGGCASGGAWCNPFLHVCIGTKPSGSCPEVNDAVACDLYNSATDVLEDVLTADFDFFVNITADSDIPKDIFMKISPFHDHEGAPEALGQPSVQCFSFDDFQSWQIFDAPAVDALVKLTCPYGFYGGDCQIACEPTSPNMYCNGKGELRCNPGFGGEDCSIGCRNSTNVYCDSATGEDICREGFHVLPDCLVVCKESEAYSCDIDGNKVCHAGFFGDECDKECTQTESTTCDKNGDLLCKANYYTEDCSVKCVSGPSHVCDVKTGQKVCMIGYVANDDLCSCAPDNVGCVETDFRDAAITELSNDSISSGGSMSAGAIVGIVFGVLIAIALIFALVCCCKRKREKAQKKQKAMTHAPPVMARA